MGHCANRKQDPGGAVVILVGMNDKFFRPTFLREFLDVDDRFVSVDPEIVVENKVDVVRQQFFARRLLANGLKSAFMHFQFVGSGEEGAANWILPNRVRDRSFLDDEIVQTFLRGCVGGGQSRRTGADDQ